MSIVTDALNRLQSERSQKIGPTSSGSTSPVISIFSRSPHKPVPSTTPILRRVLQGLALLSVLGVIGLVAYFWGLTMIPAAPEVPTLPVEEDLPIGVPPSPTPSHRQESIDVPITPGPEGQDGLTASPASENTLPGHLEGVPDSPPVPKLKNTTPALKPVPVTPLRSTSIPERRSNALPTVSSPEKKPIQADPVKPEVRTGPAKVPGKREVRSSPPPLIPSGTTVLEKRLSLVKQLINRKRYGQAMTLLEPLFVAPPEQWEVWFWRGTAHLGLGQLAQAEDSFVEGLALDSTIPHLWVQRALVSQQRGQFGDAVESLRQAELLAPELPEVQLNLGYVLEVRGDARPAVEHYQTFLALTEGKRTYQSARKKVFHRVLQLKKS